MKHLVLAVCTLLCPMIGTAFGQVPATSLRVGLEMRWGFGDDLFTVADSSQPSGFALVSGPVEKHMGVGVHIGLEHRLRSNVVFGGEVGFSTLKYQGSVRYSLANDTVGETRGENYWNGMGRIGYALDRAVPYIGVGVMNSRNSAAVSDDCNTPPCGSSVGSGSGTTATNSWFLAYGVQFDVHKWIALRFEYVQIQNDPIVNRFTRTLSGIGIAAGATAPVEVTTPLQRNALRILIDVPLRKWGS